MGKQDIQKEINVINKARSEKEKVKIKQVKFLLFTLYF